MHAGVKNEADEIAKELSSLTGLRAIPILDLPAAIIVHGGPGALGISFFSEK
jgi:fatty acid-binding protein DegV